MQSNLGYNKSLFILPFDHRSSFAKLFGFTKLTEEEKNYIVAAKKLIYEAFQKALLQEIPKDQAAILVDEEYGDEILKDAIGKNIITLLTTEKSGQESFEFEYGNDFSKHIEKYKPSFVKVLIRYNSSMDCTKLKILSDYCHSNGYKFLLEVLTKNKTKDEAVMAIKKLQDERVEPDVWKLEGMEEEKDYQDIVYQAQDGNRQNVKIVILGRGANQKAVEKWISAGSKINGIIGFAVGRTVFAEPLGKYKNAEITKEEAIEAICNNFLHFYHIFIKKQ